ncbi:MAG TPA: carboxypeptidase-like regulatory domain-containing protein [Edaphobacter sp.]
MSPASHSLSRWPALFLWFASLLALCVSLPAQMASLAGTSATSSTAPITVMGQVLNAVTGEPIPRVLVRLNDRSVLTTHEGKFEFDQYTGSNNTTLQATKPGYYLSADPSDRPVINLTADQLAEPIEVRLYPEALLTGTVTSADGEPIPHLSVTARRNDFDGFAQRWAQNGQSQTDSHGNFRLPVPPGDYKLETRYMGRSSMQTSDIVIPLIFPEHSSSATSDMIHISSGEQLHFDLHPRISRVYDIAASIEGMPGRAYPNITARSSDGSVFPVPLNQNGTSDEFRMQLPTGTYAINATVNGPDSSPAYAQAVITVPDHDISGVVLHVTPNPGVPVELQLDPSVSTTSSTSDNVTPPNLPQLGLTLISADPDHDYGIVGLLPTRNQSFNFVVPPGSYRLQARGRGQWYIKAVNYGTSDLLQQDLVIGPGSSGTPIRVTVSNQTSALQGTLRVNGKAASCWLYLIPSSPSADSFVSVHSGASGSYTANYLPPGGYQAVAFEHRYPADLRDPETLARFSTYVHAITVNVGDKPTLDFDAVPAAEMLP